MKEVIQEWFEISEERGGWYSFGWVFKDTLEYVDNSWKITEHLEYDKYHHPILGVATKETELWTK